MEPSREILWNIPLGELVYLFGAVVVALLVYTGYRRYRMWRIGKPDPRLTGGDLSRRLKAFLTAMVVDGVIHRKFFGILDNLSHRPVKASDFIAKELYPGIAHFLMFVGCFILLAGTATDVVSHFIIDFLRGGVYFGHSLATDIGGVMAIVGVLMAIFRRYVQKPSRLDNKTEDLVALLAILIIVVTGFIVEGYRIAAAELRQNPTWAPWSPVGYGLAIAFSGMSQGVLEASHRIWWWLHMLISMGGMAYIALNFNRLWHIVVDPWNVYLRDLGPRGAIAPIDLEKAESFGVSKIQDLTWKHILDLDACTRCGRCQDNCPAKLSDKPLNPKKVIQDLKAEWLRQAPRLLKASKPAAGGEQKAPPAEAPPPETAGAKPMLGGVILEDEIWNCTTCFACHEVCPVSIEPMAKLIEMRRNLVLEQASIPETGEGALRSIEDRGHPWRGTMLTRESWCEGMGIKPLAEDPNVDILYWVGCTSALEDRSMKVSRAIAGLLKAAGVNFGILCTDESCCGDPARRLGNEYLYQMQAQKNIEVMKTYNVKRIVTGCAHCYNTLKYEYPQFGGNYEVVHHTDFIMQLLKEGKLKPGKALNAVVTYHDSCYIGRYNNIYDTPRQILSKLPGIRLVEMKRNRERGFCCGAGGGHLWLEEQKKGERINVMRTDQAITTGARIIATACPYCLQMFEDGLRTREAQETHRTADIAELLLESTQPEKQ